MSDDIWKTHDEAAPASTEAPRPRSLPPGSAFGLLWWPPEPVIDVEAGDLRDDADR